VGPAPSSSITPAELFDLHSRLTEEARTLMGNKNHDYTAGSGDALHNFRGAVTRGLVRNAGASVLVRMDDKFARLCSASLTDLKVADEKVVDTVKDLINYAVLFYAAYREGDAQALNNIKEGISTNLEDLRTASDPIAGQHTSLPPRFRGSRPYSKVLVATGCFDQLHAGHIHLLARMFHHACDVKGAIELFIDSDERVTQLKGPGRPIQCFGARCEAIFTFFKTFLTLPGEFRPPISIFSFTTMGQLEDLFKSANPTHVYRGGSALQNVYTGGLHGVELVFVPILPGHSTTENLEAKMGKAL